MTETPQKYVAEPRKYKDKAWLREQYWGKERTQYDIADECGVTQETIREWMNEHGIPRRRDSWQREAGEYDPITDFGGHLDNNEEDERPNWNVVVDNETVVSADD